MTAEHGSNGDEDRPSSFARGDLWSAATVIVVADSAMSLDNVVALAAIARGNFWLLAAGVAFSIPVLAYGGLILSTLLKNAPGLVAIGAALLGWIAGDMAVSDPLVANWANVNAPGLVAIAPALGAAFVFLNGWLAPGRPAPRSIARPAPTRAVKPAAPAALAPAPARPSAPAFEPPEPRARRANASREDRVALIGVLIFAAIAGLVLLVVSYLDSLN